MPQGTCKKISGGTLEPPKGVEFAPRLAAHSLGASVYSGTTVRGAVIQPCSDTCGARKRATKAATVPLAM